MGDAARLQISSCLLKLGGVAQVRCAFEWPSREQLSGLFCGRFFGAWAHY